MSVFIAVGAVALDLWLGEPRRWHPLVGFGALASRVERGLNGCPENPIRSLMAGVLALALLLVPVTALAFLFAATVPTWLLLGSEALVLYLALSVRGLSEHGLSVALALKAGDLALAREQVGRIVSRRAEALDAAGVSAAATESMLENGADAVFASLFWFLIAGLPGVIVHRLINTLDAMWGYRNARFLYFGRAAARLDDAMNWVPARLTALTYALLGQTAPALQCWRNQGPTWDSPNAGPVMASGAGALGVTLGGPAPYAAGWRERPVLGHGLPPTADSIVAAIRLVKRGVVLWLLVLGGVGGWLSW